MSQANITIHEVKFGEEPKWSCYLHFRWEQLRQPLGLPPGSERDELESQAYHLAARTLDCDRVIGAGRLHLNTSSEAQIRYMAVAKSHQSCGLGGRILTALCLEATKRQAAFVILNARSEIAGFYERYGFRNMTNGRFDHLGISHQKMSKTL